MKRMPFKFILVILTAVLIQSCPSVRNIPSHEIRTQKHFHKEFKTNKTINEIQISIFEYNKACRPIPTLIIDPNNQKEAFILLSAPGWTDSSVIVVMDFIENGNSTTIRTYSYYSTWHRHIEKIIKAIEEPKECN